MEEAIRRSLAEGGGGSRAQPPPEDVVDLAAQEDEAAARVDAAGGAARQASGVRGAAGGAAPGAEAAEASDVDLDWEDVGPEEAAPAQQSAQQLHASINRESAERLEEWLQGDAAANGGEEAGPPAAARSTQGEPGVQVAQEDGLLWEDVPAAGDTGAAGQGQRADSQEPAAAAAGEQPGPQQLGGWEAAEAQPGPLGEAQHAAALRKPAAGQGEQQQQGSVAPGPASAQPPEAATAAAAGTLRQRGATQRPHAAPVAPADQRSGGGEQEAAPVAAVPARAVAAGKQVRFSAEVQVGSLEAGFGAAAEAAEAGAGGSAADGVPSAAPAPAAAAAAVGPPAARAGTPPPEQRGEVAAGARAPASAARSAAAEAHPASLATAAGYSPADLAALLAEEEELHDQRSQQAGGQAAHPQQQQQQPPEWAPEDLEAEMEELLAEEAQLQAAQRAQRGQAETPTAQMYEDWQELLQVQGPARVCACTRRGALQAAGTGTGQAPAAGLQPLPPPVPSAPLWQMFGLPYIIAPQEAEAQCAWLNAEGLVDGVVTDDADAFLFGAQRVYRWGGGAEVAGPGRGPWQGAAARPPACMRRAG